jgi:hypothetical protein
MNQTGEPQYQERFRKALERLMREIDNVRTEQAAIAAYQDIQPPKNRFLYTAFLALLGDRLLRLIRIFEDNPQAASFWYLHRCARERMKIPDIGRLQDFSNRLKIVRDLSFVHIDKRGVFNPKGIWREAGIAEKDASYAVETVRRILVDLWKEEFGQLFIAASDNSDPRPYGIDLDEIKELLKRSLNELSPRR